MGEAIAEVGYLAGLCGHDGTDWLKLAVDADGYLARYNLPWGYSAIWDEDLGGVATGATWQVLSEEVPSGELWILQLISIRNLNRATTNVILYSARAAGGQTEFAGVGALAQSTVLSWSGALALAEGDKVGVYMAGCLAGDSIFAGVGGYKMELNT